jgi:transposase
VLLEAGLALLEGQMECWLLNAAHLHNVPGRKTDVADAAWIAQLVEHGLVRPSVVPPRPIRELREPGPRSHDPDPSAPPGGPAAGSRSWRMLGPELSSVATDVLGVSGRAMLDALVAGPTTRRCWPRWPRVRLRTKLPALREAWPATSGPTSTHLLVAQILAHIDDLDEAIAVLSARIQQPVGPFVEQVALWDTIPGVDQRAAEVILAELGPDMTQFPTAAHLASWAGGVPWEQRVGRQAPLGADPQGVQVAGWLPGARSPRRPAGPRAPT